MPPASKALLFFGNERLVSGLDSTDAPILRGLLNRGYRVKAVISHHSDTRSRKPRPLEVAEIAAKYDIPVFLPNKPADIIDELKSFRADAAVLVAYGRLIPQRVIDIFPQGIINIHPSLLPRYRGPTPIESVVLNGDKTTGVSIMQLGAGMDDGPVYTQQEIPLDGTETKFEVYDKLKTLSETLLFAHLPAILDGTLQPTPQNNSNATYCKLLDKKDGLLDPTRLTTTEAERTVRAFLGFPKTSLTIGNQRIIITKAHVASEQKTPLDILFKDGAFLSIDELIAPSGKTMNAAAFLRGYVA